MSATPRARHADPGQRLAAGADRPHGRSLRRPERDEAVELAVHTLLERLTATERAVFVLREAFDYPYRQIADLLELSEANARHCSIRARGRLSVERRPPVNGIERNRLRQAFAAASQTGDLAPLERLLVGEATAAPLAIAA